MLNSTENQKPRLAWARQKYTPFGGAERFIEQALPSLIHQGFQLAFYTRSWPTQAGLAQIQPVTCNPWYLGKIWRDLGFARAVRHTHQQRQKNQSRELLQSHERIPGCDLFRAGDGVHAVWLQERKRAASFWEGCQITLNPYHHYLLATERRLFEHPQLQAVICNSKMVRDEILQRFAIPAERLHVIYNAVDHARFHPKLREEHRTTIRRRYHIPETATLLLFVGSGYQRKGLMQTLLALKEVIASSTAKAANFRLLVLGKDKKIAHYQQFAQKLGVHSRVIFVGPQEEVAPFYGAADIFVLPTLYDPCPNAALEAMASGLPLITSTKCGAAELVSQHQAGLICDALDIRTLARHIYTLVEPNARTTHANGSLQATVELTQENMIYKLLHLYESCWKNTP